MKKINKLPLLIVIALALTGCTKNKNAIKQITNYDIVYKGSQDIKSNLVDLSAESINSMVDADYSFLLFMYSDYCSSCSEVKNNLVKYFSQSGNQHVIYSFCCDYPVEYNKLNEANPEIFKEKVDTPELKVIKNGEQVDSIAVSKLVNERLIKSAINSFLLDSNIYYVSNTDSYNAFKTKYSDYKEIIYSSETKEGMKPLLDAYNDTSNQTYLVIDTFIYKN